MEKAKSKSTRKIDTELENYFAVLFEENEVGEGKNDILARATDAVNHFSGNALTQLIIARDHPKMLIFENLQQATFEYQRRFLEGLSQIQLEELMLRSEIAAVEYARIQFKAEHGSWSDLKFLKDLLESCVRYTSVLHDYATTPKSQRG